MQVTFGINMVALDHGQPRLFNLKEIIESFVLHRREVVHVVLSLSFAKHVNVRTFWKV